MTVNEAYQQLKADLVFLYDENEASNLANQAIEHITHLNRTERLINKLKRLSPQQLELLNSVSFELKTGKPIQYIFNEAWFGGLTFFVNEHVLIPRPETDELVELITTTINPNSSVIDIGTGSGCIPISIKKKLPNTTVTAIDVSARALEVAQKNAAKHEVNIELLHLNFLDEVSWQQFEKFDVIVSNPPYIKQAEITTMHKNVVEFEPHLALFVEDNDALIFYKKIAQFALHHLNKNGFVFVEINEALGKETLSLFEKNNLQASLIKDMQGKDRMIMAQLK